MQDEDEEQEQTPISLANEVLARIDKHCSEIHKVLSSCRNPSRRTRGILWPKSIHDDNPYSNILAFSKTSGVDNLERIRELRIAVFGLGGVGSVCAENLARCGAQKLLLFDYGFVRPCDLTGMLYTPRDIGWRKVEACKNRIQQINPDVVVETFKFDFSDPERQQKLKSILKLSSGKQPSQPSSKPPKHRYTRRLSLLEQIAMIDMPHSVDIVLSCSNSASTRLALNEICLEVNLTLVDIYSSPDASDIVIRTIVPGRTACLCCNGDAEREAKEEAAILESLPPPDPRLLADATKMTDTEEKKANAVATAFLSAGRGTLGCFSTIRESEEESSSQPETAGEKKEEGPKKNSGKVGRKIDDARENGETEKILKENQEREFQGEGLTLNKEVEAVPTTTATVDSSSSSASSSSIQDGDGDLPSTPSPTEDVTTASKANEGVKEGSNDERKSRAKRGAPSTGSGGDEGGGGGSTKAAVATAATSGAVTGKRSRRRRKRKTASEKETTGSSIIQEENEHDDASLIAKRVNPAHLPTMISISAGLVGQCVMKALFIPHAVHAVVRFNGLLGTVEAKESVLPNPACPNISCNLSQKIRANSGGGKGADAIM